MEIEEPCYNYHGPKIVLPELECPITICTTDMIGMVKKATLASTDDSGLMVFMIKRSNLLPNVVSKMISLTKKISILAGRIKAQDVLTLRDLRLSEFDKTGVLVNKRL